MAKIKSKRHASYRHVAASGRSGQRHNLQNAIYRIIYIFLDNINQPRIPLTQSRCRQDSAAQAVFTIQDDTKDH